MASELESLRAFAQEVLGDWPESFPDGFDIQDLAEKHGLLKLKDPKPMQPCQEEGCRCAEYFDERDWAAGVDCFQRTPLLTGQTPDGMKEDQRG